MTKAIINKKTYNTETAELIARGTNGLHPGDCWYRTEELYRTKKGAYFINTQSDRLIVVHQNGNFDLDPTYNLTCTLAEWLQDWNVQTLPAREMEFFGITEA